MKNYKINETKIDEGMHHLVRREANKMIDEANEGYIGNKADNFMRILVMAGRYIDVTQYDGLVVKCMDECQRNKSSRE